MTKVVDWVESKVVFVLMCDANGHVGSVRGREVSEEEDIDVDEVVEPEPPKKTAAKVKSSSSVPVAQTPKKGTATDLHPAEPKSVSKPPSVKGGRPGSSSKQEKLPNLSCAKCDKKLREVALLFLSLSS